MAFVKNYDPDAEEQDQENTGSVSGSALNPTITTGGQTNETQAGTAGTTGANKQSSNFSGLQKYLSANQQGAQNLGAQVAGDVTSATNAAQQQLGTAKDIYGNKIQQGTTVFNQDVVDKAATDASTYETDAELQKQLSGAYAGPDDFIGSEEDTATQEAINKAQEKADLASTSAGRQQLLKQQAPGLTSGGLNLNQYLLENTEPAWNQVQTAAKGVDPLYDQYYDTVTGIRGNIAGAQQTSAATKAAALARLGQGAGNIKGQITQTLAQKQAEVDAAEAAKKVNSLAEAGATPQQIADFNDANRVIQEAGGEPINFQQFLQGGRAQQLGTADVASEKQAKDLAALARLTGDTSNFLQRGTAGQGQTLSASLFDKLAAEKTKAQGTLAERAAAAAKAQADAAKAAADAKTRAEAEAAARQKAEADAEAARVKAEQDAAAAEAARIEAEKVAAAQEKKTTQLPPTAPAGTERTGSNDDALKVQYDADAANRNALLQADYLEQRPEAGKLPLNWYNGPYGPEKILVQDGKRMRVVGGKLVPMTDEETAKYPGLGVNEEIKKTTQPVDPLAGLIAGTPPPVLNAPRGQELPPNLHDPKYGAQRASGQWYMNQQYYDDLNAYYGRIGDPRYVDMSGYQYNPNSWGSV